MARKFKKKLASRPLKVEKRVLSIEIIGKEYLEKVRSFKNWIISKFKSSKLAD